MDTNKTYTIKQNESTIWYLIDAKHQILGRLSTKIVNLIKGKNQAYYQPEVIDNINIIIINAQYINISGKKKEQKLYKRHSGRPGGMKVETFNELLSRKPIQILEKAIRGMLPKNKLGKKLFTHLKIYAEDKHPHSAQKPNIITL